MPLSPRMHGPKRAALALLAVLAVGALTLFAFPPVRAAMKKLLGGNGAPHGHARPAKPAKPVELIEDGHGHDGLRLSAAAIANLEIHPIAVEVAVRHRPLPPQVGNLNYDYVRLHVIRPRFAGEVVALLQVPDGGHPPYGPVTKHPVTLGDRVKPGDVLAVLWCRDLGEKKAALVDAIQNLRLSQNTLERQRKLFAEGGTSLATLNATERQFTLDTNAVLTAERTLKMWKLSDKDVASIKKEANDIHDQKKTRDADLEKQWARVEIKVPETPGVPPRTYTVLENNTSVGEMVDPARELPLFRIADLSRLQILVHPPEEYLPLFQDYLQKHGPGSLRWQIHVMADPKQTPLDLPITQIAPSLEPNQRTPTLIGYLDNPEGRYLVGQFVEATIFVPPPEDTVQVPTEAINQYEGQNFVFVQNPAKADELFLRRVVLVSNSGGAVLLRSRLTPDDEQMSHFERAKGHRPLEPLLPGDKVITHGVVELTSALDELVTNRDADRQPPAAMEAKR